MVVLLFFFFPILVNVLHIGKVCLDMIDEQQRETNATQNDNSTPLQTTQQTKRSHPEHNPVSVHNHVVVLEGFQHAVHFGSPEFTPISAFRISLLLHGG